MVNNNVSIQEAAKAVAASRYFRDISSPDQALVILMLADELDINRFDACRGLRVQEGNLAMSAGLIASKIKRSGFANFDIATHDEKQCVLRFRRKEGDSEWKPCDPEISYTIEEAKRAGLLDKADAKYNPWLKYPSDMLFARALTRGARRHCPDLFGGSVYTPDELGASLDNFREGDVDEAPESHEEPRPARTASAAQPVQPAEAADPNREKLLNQIEKAFVKSANQSEAYKTAAAWVQDNVAKGFDREKLKKLAMTKPADVRAEIERILKGEDAAGNEAESDGADGTDGADGATTADGADGSGGADVETKTTPRTDQELAAEFVGRYRGHKYSDDKILLVAKMQKPELRKAIEELLKQPAAILQTDETAPATGDEPTNPKPHILELLKACAEFNLGETNKERWLTHFKVKTLDDLTPEQTKAIIAQARKLYKKGGK